MVKDNTMIEEHAPPKLTGPEEEVKVCVKIPKNYIERMDALYLLWRGDPDFELANFIRNAIKVSLQMYVSELGVSDPELEPKVSGEDGETSQ